MNKELLQKILDTIRNCLTELVMIRYSMLKDLNNAINKLSELEMEIENILMDYSCSHGGENAKETSN